MDDIHDISKQPLIEWESQTVITTAQLAKVYGTTTKNVTKNFNRNKERFEIGKHYFVLQGEELKEFMRVAPERYLPPSTSIAYLWTRRGASRHCKILGTDKAWEQFDYLEDNYFDREKHAQQSPPLTLQQQVQTIAQGTAELYEKVDKVDSKVDALDKKLQDELMNLPILGVEENKIEKATRRRGTEVLGGKQSNAYNDKSLRGKLYWDLHIQLRREFGVSTYKAIKRNQADLALKFLAEYRPPLYLQEQIEQANAQQSLDFEDDPGG